MRALREHSARMRALVVGGSVRDAVLGHDPNDIDIEVYGVNYQDLASTLEAYGKTDLVGKQFGVVKFRDETSREIDISVPRR
jgi:tRNA nucleotidyltransferase (CCA-adding enzyme)